MRRLPESLTVLRQRDFRLLFGAYAVSVLGDRMVNRPAHLVYEVVDNEVRTMPGD